MGKKQTLLNSQIIEKLTSAGLVPESRYGMIIQGNASYYYYRIKPDKISYKIPVDIYNKVVGKRFTTPLKLSNVVRVRNKSTRNNSRRSYSSQDIGDIYNWGHLGIGSGKNYLEDDLKPIRSNNGYIYNVRPIENPLTIGQDYIMNVRVALALEKKYIELEYKYVSSINPSGYQYKENVRANLFFEKVKLKPTGLFGPKRLINGYITEIYVHFLWPDWKFKREARYQVTFDTGAVGIFTSDMLDRVFDTDYEIDEKLSCCEARIKGENCNLTSCDHMGVHLGVDECQEYCPYSDKKCSTLYDFTQLCETTIQRGIGKDEEEE